MVGKSADHLVAASEGDLIQGDFRHLVAAGDRVDGVVRLHRSGSRNPLSGRGRVLGPEDVDPRGDHEDTSDKDDDSDRDGTIARF